jgi:capsular polysaccharide export protein
MTRSKVGQNQRPRVGVFSRRLAGLENLRTVLNADTIVLGPTASQARNLDAIIGWGHKRSALGARQFAKDQGLPYWAIEDGFLRSVGLGKDCPPLSLIVDPRGIYYDATGPSILEDLLASAGASDRLADSELLIRAKRCRERVVQARLSKYNHTVDEVPSELLDAKQPVVLVVDQTLGDASVDLGNASPKRFTEMLSAACAENPNATIFLKIHPETIAGVKPGYLSQERLPSRVRLLSTAANPLALLALVERVYVCTSQLGFEALMLDKPVTCFGIPFYAGWGLTDDRYSCDRRCRERTIDELVAATLILYPRYVHPHSGAKAEVEEVIEHLVLQRSQFSENLGRIFCFGVSIWKRPFVRRYLQAPQNDVRFYRSVRSLRAALDSQPTRLLAWGSKPHDQLRDLAEQRNLMLLRMEDGFIRSVGLGSDLSAPGSLVIDRRGIYYDPRQPSDLEALLETTDFTVSELSRAARLREHIVQSGVSKYNSVADRSFCPKARPSQTIVLVAGQVENDASVLQGSPTVRSNLALLDAVRRLRPDAHIIYKPHPDVVSGNRPGKIVGSGIQPFDEIITDVPIGRCLEAADELHTMTSLVGFEALLRGKPVVVHGQPFYAGWGLTEDLEPIPRRKRRLQLDELVAGVLLVYPRYYNFRKLAFCTAEDLIAELLTQRNSQSRRLQHPWLLRRSRSLLALAREILHAR